MLDRYSDLGCAREGDSFLKAGRCGQAQAGLISDDPVQAKLMLTCCRGRFRPVAVTRGVPMRRMQDAGLLDRGVYES